MNRRTLVLLALCFCVLLCLTTVADAKKKKKSKKAKVEAEVKETVLSIDPSTVSEEVLRTITEDVAKVDNSASAAPVVVEEAAATVADTPAPVETVSDNSSVQQQESNTVLTDDDFLESDAKSEVKKLSPEDRKKRASRAAKKQKKRQEKIDSLLRKVKYRNQQLAVAREERAKALLDKRAQVQKKVDKVAKVKLVRETPEMKKSCEEKRRWLDRETARSSTRIINSDSASFRTYANNHPRCYYLFTSLTALTAAHMCPKCHEANSALIPAAQAHYEVRKSLQQKLDDGQTLTADELERLETPIYFMNVDFVRNKEIFDTLGIKAVPIFQIFAPVYDNKQPNINQVLNSVPFKQKFQPINPTFEASEFLSFIVKITGYDATYTPPFPIFNLIIFLFTAIGGGYLLIQYSHLFLKVRLYGWLFSLSSWLLYLFSISGGMYNIIRGTEFARVDEKGKTQYIAHGSRDQYSLEGYLMGGAQVLISLLLVILARHAWKETTSQQDKKKDNKSSSTDNMFSILSSLCSPPVCLVGCAVLWMTVVDVYRRKGG